MLRKNTRAFIIWMVQFDTVVSPVGQQWDTTVLHLAIDMSYFQSNQMASFG